MKTLSRHSDAVVAVVAAELHHLFSLTFATEQQTSGALGSPHPGSTLGMLHRPAAEERLLTARGAAEPQGCGETYLREKSDVREE